jgi:hypothetical protein
MRENSAIGEIQFRKAYLRSVIDRIEVDDHAIRVIGDIATLEQVVAEKSVPAAGVRSFVRKWRTGRDSNSAPQDHRDYFSVVPAIGRAANKQQDCSQMTGILLRTERCCGPEAGNGGALGCTPQRDVACGVEVVRRMASRNLEDPMSKTKSKGVKTRASRRARTSKRAKTSRPRSTARPASTRGNSKQAKVLELLRAPAVMEATGWQSHSVRGFLAGVIRKKLGLNLLSEAGDDGRIYRVKVERSGAAATT